MASEPMPEIPAPPELDKLPDKLPVRRRAGLLSVAALAVVPAATFAWLLMRPAPAPDSETRIAVLPLADETGNAEFAWTRLGLMSYVSNLLAADGSLPVEPPSQTE